MMYINVSFPIKKKDKRREWEKKWIERHFNQRREISGNSEERILLMTLQLRREKYTVVYFITSPVKRKGSTGERVLGKMLSYRL